MPSLPDVTQTFEADVQPYIDELMRAAAAARAFADDAAQAAAMAQELGFSSRAAAAELEALERIETAISGVSLTLAASWRDAVDAAVALLGDTAQLALILNVLRDILEKVSKSAAGTAAMLKLLGAQQKALLANTAAVAAGMKTMSAAMQDAASGGGGGMRFLGWAGLTRQALHWIVMGTLEFASVAIPALVALGAAAMGMYPTITRIIDATHNLIVASGGLHNALLNSVGPLHNLGIQFGQTAKLMQPDVYVIFGAIINSLSSRFNVFGQIAQKAGIILANFATKIEVDLAGQAGQMLANFFTHAISDFVVFGQLLGTLGHIFLVLASDMLGVGRDVFGVLNMLAQAFLHLIQLPIVGTLIGWLAAISALVRWGGLLAVVLKFLFSPIILLVNQLKIAIPLLLNFGATFDILAADIGTADAALAIFEALTGIGIVLLGGIALALGLFALSTHNAADAQDVLISKMNKLPPTANNLNASISTLANRLATTAAAMDKLTREQLKMAQGGMNNLHAIDTSRLAIEHYQNDIQKGIVAIRQWANALINLQTGLAQTGAGTRQVAAGTQAMEIQTALADSQIQNLNNALDQYVNLLTGGTSATANFVQAINNIGSVTATTNINNLSQSTQTLSLNVKQFGKALSQTTTTGSSAWQNFDQVMTGSMQPLADWFRTAGVLIPHFGATTDAAVKQMAQVMGQYAGSNKVAQAQVLGWARANGITANSFSQLMHGAKPIPQALSMIAQWAGQATIKLSSLSTMAKNAAAVLSTQVAGAIAKTALQASGFNNTLLKYQQDLLNTHTPQSVLQADIRAMQGELKTATDLVIKSGNATQTGMQHSSSATTSAKGVINPALDSVIQKHQHLDSQVTTTTNSVAAHHKTMADKVNANSKVMNNAMQGTIGKAQALQAQFNSMKPFNITNHVTTVYSTQGSPSPNSPILPYHGAVVWQKHGGVMGYQGGGYVGSGMGGMDRIPAMLSLGEGVLTKAATAALGGPLGIRNLNDNPHLGLDQRGGGGTINLTIITPVQLDGHTISNQQRTETLIYNRRNPTNNLTLNRR